MSTNAAKITSMLNGDYHPISEGNVIVWLDSSSVIQSGTVSQVNDQSGNGRHATQSTGTNRPTYISSDANFKDQPSISHDGVDNYVDVAAFTTVAQPVTVYGVARPTALGSKFLLDDIDGTSRVALFDNGVASLSVFAGTVLSGGTAWNVNTVITYGVVFNGGSTAIYINNPVTAVNTGAGGSNGLKSLRIGTRFSAAAGEFFAGQWTAMGAFVGAHNSTIRSRIMEYLNSKYRV